MIVGGTNYPLDCQQFGIAGASALNLGGGRPELEP